MYFTSFSFVVFLGVLFLGYYGPFRRFQWQFLLAASFVFYAFSGWQNLLYIGVTILSTWFAHFNMDKLLVRQEAWLALHKQAGKDEVRAHKAAVKRRRRWWFVACLVFNFSVLAVVKYANFAIGNLNALLGAFGGQPLGLVNILLPMGISFYTFQTMGLLIDSYRAKKSGFAETNPFKLALFTSFFPQLIQGPISRWAGLSQDLYTKKAFSGQAFSAGLTRVLWGFFKKLVIADRLLVAVRFLTQNTESYQGIYALIGIFFYAVTLYADFTGGIDITIGVAKMLGIRVAENFDRPFYSKNIAEYWRRWHITMGTWFRDYIFYPLTVSRPILNLQKRLRKRLGALGTRLPVYLSTIILWFLTGLWHGASWNFIAWGLANGLVIVLSTECMPLYEKFHSRFAFSNSRPYAAFQIMRTFVLMGFIRAFDIYPGVATTLRMAASVFTRPGLALFAGQGLSPLGLTWADYTICSLGVAIMILAGVVNRRKTSRAPGFLATTAVCLGLFFACLVFGMYGLGFDASQFIYNQF